MHYCRITSMGNVQMKLAICYKNWRKQNQNWHTQQTPLRVAYLKKVQTWKKITIDQTLRQNLTTTQFILNCILIAVFWFVIYVSTFDQRWDLQQGFRVEVVAICLAIFFACKANIIKMEAIPIGSQFCTPE